MLVYRDKDSGGRRIRAAGDRQSSHFKRGLGRGEAREGAMETKGCRGMSDFTPVRLLWQQASLLSTGLQCRRLGTRARLSRHPLKSCRRHGTPLQHDQDPDGNKGLFVAYL